MGMNDCFRVMDQKKGRSSKMIELALVNAGITSEANNIITLDSISLQNTFDINNTDADNVNGHGKSLKQKGHVRRKLTFDKEPKETQINECTSTIPVGRTSNIPTVNEEIENCNALWEDPFLVDADSDSCVIMPAVRTSNIPTANEEIENCNALCEDPFIVDPGADCDSCVTMPSVRTSNIPTANEEIENYNALCEDPFIVETGAQKTQSATNSTANDCSQPGGSKARRGRKRNCKTDKRYIDYLSDEDFSTFYEGADYLDSDEWLAPDTSEDDDIGKSKSKKSKKKKSVDLIQEDVVGEAGLRQKKKNLKQERQKKRTDGAEYVRKDGKTVNAKSVQPNPCSGKKCGNNCENISIEKRQQVFDHFWKLSVERRRDWLVSLTQKQPIKRKRASSEKRTTSFKYHINDGEGRRVVCLQFLAATLNISSKCIYHTVNNSEWGCAKEDLRGKCIPPNKTKPAIIESVKNFIKSLPAIPSHYCRQDSSRVYLPQEFKNISNLYCIYKKQAEDNGVDFVSEKVFRKIFTGEFNIAFHVPKKDKCLKCLKFQSDSTTDSAMAEEKASHEKEKKDSYDRFLAHKNIHKNDPSTLCASFDLEKVLNTPHGQSMMFYYSRKLAVYNLCFYENGTRRVFCYYWDESNGKRGANEIASILHKYVKSVDERGTIKNLLLYCDCCPGQNRNRTVLAMLHSTLQQCNNLETVQINYLLTGHTYMPVDSVHAVIEGNLKNILIHAPSQWYTVFATARKDPLPYEVQKLDFGDFSKWDAVAERYFKTNLTGKISKLRIVTFKKNKPSSISVKYTMNNSAKSTTIEIQSKTMPPIIQCYRSRLPISKAKYEDLVKLCKDKVIPAHFQDEYVSIPRSSTEKDTLPESDIEDVETDEN